MLWANGKGEFFRVENQTSVSRGEWIMSAHASILRLYTVKKSYERKSLTLVLTCDQAQLSYVGARYNWAWYKVSQDSVSSSRIWTKSDRLIQELEVTKICVRKCLRGSRHYGQVGFSLQHKTVEPVYFLSSGEGKVY